MLQFGGALLLQNVDKQLVVLGLKDRVLVHEKVDGGLGVLLAVRDELFEEGRVVSHAFHTVPVDVRQVGLEFHHEHYLFGKNR